MVTKLADILAVPLADIYNSIKNTGIWPLTWKEERVTVIPKCSIPQSMNDLRNISCTLLVSKMMESYVLEWLHSEVKISDRQYGGIKGCSAAHLLVDVWGRVCEDLEDSRAASLLLSVDYAKAFNRLSYQHCLSAFAKKGASSLTIGLIASFLTNRTMSVRVGNSWSPPMPVFGGAPQGSILGVMLFNCSIDDLEEGTVVTPVLDGVGDETEEDGSVTSAGPTAISTPQRTESNPPAWEASPGGLSPVGQFDRRLEEGVTFEYLPNARNVRRALLADWSTFEEVPEEPNPVTSAAWRPKDIGVYKYIDDGLQIEKINMETAVRYDIGGEERRRKHAVPSQNFYRHVTKKAVGRGMKINSSKTKLLCISDALSYSPEAEIRDLNGSLLVTTPGDCLKMLGFHFSSKPNVTKHIEVLKKRFRSRLWILIHLKNAGFNREELVRVYKVVLRPVHDYLCTVYHSMMTDAQDEEVERLQAHALKYIFGWKQSYVQLRALADVETLRARRIALSDKFAQKCLGSTRFSKWFPLKTGVRASSRNTGSTEK